MFLLREVAADFEYGEAQAIEDERMEEKRIEELLERIQGYDLRGMLIESMSDQALVDYEMVQYVLNRLPRIPGADDELKSDIWHLVLDNADLLYPASEHIARYVISFQNIPKGEKVRIAKKLLKPLRSRRNCPPDYYAMWVLHVFQLLPTGTALPKLWACTKALRQSWLRDLLHWLLLRAEVEQVHLL